jgi:hypothetical protein
MKIEDEVPITTPARDHRNISATGYDHRFFGSLCLICITALGRRKLDGDDRFPECRQCGDHGIRVSDATRAATHQEGRRRPMILLRKLMWHQAERGDRDVAVGEAHG